MHKQVYKQHTKLLRALANPKRFEVMCLLRRGALTVSDMERTMGIKQANISQHLMVLRRAGVVASVHKGRKVYYHLTCPGTTCISAALRVTSMISSIAITKNIKATDEM